MQKKILEKPLKCMRTVGENNVKMLEHNLEVPLERQLNNCTFVKFILMILVVVYHCALFWTGDWFTGNPIYSSTSLEWFSMWLNSFHIYGFTLVSGYLFYYIKYEKLGYESFQKFVIIKVKRLIIPYVFVATVWVVPIQFHFFRYDILTIVNNYILAKSPNQLWFLLMLFIVFVLYYPLSKWMKNNYYGIIIILLMYKLGLYADETIGNLLMLNRALKYILLFWIGFKIREGKMDFIWKIPSWIYIVIDILLFVFSTKYLPGSIYYLKDIDMLCDALLHCLGAVMSFVVLQRIASDISWNKSKILAKLTKYSMPIYLFHQQIIYFSIHWFNGKIVPWLHFVLNMVVTLIVVLIISKILMSFKVTRYLIGEK